jgi:Na+-transporting NADH:ubiquinone oxidoreductase subunit C
LVGIRVLKGKGNTFAADGHDVDGISGATITCNGVTKFVKADLEKYEAFFKGSN